MHRIEVTGGILDLETRELRTVAERDRAGVKDHAVARARVARPALRCALVGERPAALGRRVHREADRIPEIAVDEIAAVDAKKLGAVVADEHLAVAVVGRRTIRTKVRRDLEHIAEAGVLVDGPVGGEGRDGQQNGEERKDQTHRKLQRGTCPPAPRRSIARR